MPVNVSLELKKALETMNSLQRELDEFTKYRETLDRLVEQLSKNTIANSEKIIEIDKRLKKIEEELQLK